jgi:hypothetical protein
MSKNLLVDVGEITGGAKWYLFYVA